MCDMTDAEIDAALASSDQLAEEIEGLFRGKQAADCVMALATVFGRCVARFDDGIVPPAERFRHFAEAASFEMESERMRRAH